MSATARSCIRRSPLRSVSTEGHGETSAWSRLSRERRGRKFLPRDASPRVHQPVRFFPRNGPAFISRLFQAWEVEFRAPPDAGGPARGHRLEPCVEAHAFGAID